MDAAPDQSQQVARVLEHTGDIDGAELTPKLVVADPEKHLKAFTTYWAANGPDLSDGKVLPAHELQFWIAKRSAAKRHLKRRKSKKGEAKSAPKRDKKGPHKHLPVSHKTQICVLKPKSVFAKRKSVF